jgi:hypothetical protein
MPGAELDRSGELIFLTIRSFGVPGGRVDRSRASGNAGV